MILCSPLSNNVEGHASVANKGRKPAAQHQYCHEHEKRLQCDQSLSRMHVFLWSISIFCNMVRNIHVEVNFVDIYGRAIVATDEGRD